MVTCGTIIVEPAFDSDNVEVVECGANTDTIEVEDEFELTAELENDNEQFADFKLIWYVGGDRVAETEDTIPAEGSLDVAESMTFTEEMYEDIGGPTDSAAVEYRLTGVSENTSSGGSGGGGRAPRQSPNYGRGRGRSRASRTRVAGGR